MSETFVSPPKGWWKYPKGTVVAHVGLQDEDLGGAAMWPIQLEGPGGLHLCTLLSLDSTESEAGAVEDEHPVETAAGVLFASIQRHLNDDLEDADQGRGTAPSALARLACYKLAKRLAPAVAAVTSVKCAAFTDDDGGVSLVVQSFDTRRRVDFDISADGTHIIATTVDERVGVRRYEVADVSDAKVEGLAGWVIRNA